VKGGLKPGGCLTNSRTKTNQIKPQPIHQAAYIKQPKETLPQLRRTLYDQYEVSFPLTVAGDCFSAVLESAYGADLMGVDKANR